MKRRVLITVMTAVFLFSACIGRIGWLVFGNTQWTAQGYNSFSLTVDIAQPNIYYRDGSRATNNTSVLYAVLRPNKKTFFEIQLIYSRGETREITEALEKGKPLIREAAADAPRKTRYISYVEGNGSSHQLPQLLNRESSGLLNYLPERVGRRKISFTVDALGRVLAGDAGTVTDEDYDSGEGVRISVDQRVQQIAVEAAADMKNGCILIMNTDDASVLACVSKPDSTYLNKPFQLYTPGSVFKTVVAACALENRMNPVFTCSGSIRVGDTEFGCAKHKTHGKQRLKDAYANSCNCYFISLAHSLGADRIRETAEKLGYFDMASLYDGWQVRHARFPSDSALQSKGELALLGFGQGSLLVTPLQIGSDLCTVANRGVRLPVRLVFDKVDKAGRQTPIPSDKGKRALREDTCSALMGYMRYVVEEGTGRSADWLGQSAGKSGTAQTGQYRDGKEQYNTWFAGVYPCEQPRYAIVIMTENGTSGSADNCPIFRTIVEKLNRL